MHHRSFPVTRFSILLMLSLGFYLMTAIAIATPTSADDSQKVIQRALVETADQFVYPNYLALTSAAAELQASLSSYCDGQGTQAQVHSAFETSFLAWQRASLIQLGPIMEAEGPMRFQLWPDSKGFARRAIKRAVSKQSSSLLEPGAMEGRSIALVNLTALELLLYEELLPQTYPCSLSIAIATYQSDLAKKITNDWKPGSDYRYEHDKALDGSKLYPTSEDLLREYLAGAVAYTDRLKKFKLLRGLGEAPGETRAKRTEAYRSKLGLLSIAISMETLMDFLTLEEGIFTSAKQLGGTDEHIVLSITLSGLIDKLDTENGNLEQIAIDDGKEAESLREYVESLRYLEAYLKQGFFEPIGMTAGFSSADGD